MKVGYHSNRISALKSATHHMSARLFHRMVGAIQASLADRMQAAIALLVVSHDNAANTPTDLRLFAGEVLAQAGALLSAAALDEPERETPLHALALLRVQE